MATNNYDRFPNNIFKPKKIVLDEEYELYKARFNSLKSLYDYLKSEPELNIKKYPELHSETNPKEFAGKPYEEAVEDLISVEKEDYERFLKLQCDLSNAKKMSINKYRTVKTVGGGRVNIPDYCAGAPICYETDEKVIKPRFIKFNVCLSYNCHTDYSQVLNRAIIITNIITSLERAGYNIDLNTFELVSVSNELVLIIVQVKKYGEKINMSNLYKILCHVEFLRRILFRVQETLDVKNFWGSGYGRTCEETLCRKIMNLDKDDIYVGQPDSLDIYGRDLVTDFENTIHHLNLDDKIDVEKAKKEFEEETVKLKLKKNN